GPTAGSMSYYPSRLNLSKGGAAGRLPVTVTLAPSVKSAIAGFEAIAPAMPKLKSHGHLIWSDMFEPFFVVFVGVD
ncbi:hypothetical protein VZ232_28970, partial [Pseudomonas aeruginosa]|uniref:hypothetical protein n=1 Tax=Pseudomonas aeruginosa TaxID=287 RepID=UPI002E29320E